MSQTVSVPITLPTLRALLDYQAGHAGSVRYFVCEALFGFELPFVGPYWCIHFIHSP